MPPLPRPPILLVLALSFVPLATPILADHHEEEAAREMEEERSEPEEGYTNTLRWSTASEVDNFGYDVYRGLAEEGPFERVNETPIPGAGTVDAPSRYSWVDETIDPHTAYWYYVESIALDGTRERFTPIFRAAPKIGGDEEPDESAEEGDDVDVEEGGNG